MNDADNRPAVVGQVQRPVRPLVERLREMSRPRYWPLLGDEAADEIERLRADLISCRGTVKTDLNHYERQAMVHGKTPHGATYEAEAQRLAALLDRIDALMEPNDKLSRRVAVGSNDWLGPTVTK